MKKKNLLKLLLFLMLLFVSINTKTESVSATVKTVKKGTEFVSSGVDGLIDFNTNMPGYIVLDMKISMENQSEVSSNEKLNVQLWGDYGYAIEDDTFDDFPKGRKGNLGSYFDYSRKKCKKGRYEYWLINRGSHSLKIEYTVKVYSTYSTSISLSQKTVNIFTDQYKVVKYSKKPSDSRMIITSIRSSNKAIAEGYTDNNSIGILAKKPGKCTITVKLFNGFKQSLSVVVKDPSTPKLLYNKYSMCRGDYFQNKLKYTKNKVVWSTSNSKVATVSQTGKIVAQGVGTCYITATSGGKKYHCKIDVVYQWPNFDAVLYSYNTRDNFFYVRFKNNSNKTLMITSGDRVEHVDYRFYDRKVRVLKPVIIKPKQCAYVRFYVNGDLTWPDYTQYTLMYNFKFDYKTYEGHVWDECSVFKNGTKWYYTSWDD